MYTPCDTQNKDAVRRTLEQIDVVHRLCQMYPETFLYVTSSAGGVLTWALQVLHPPTQPSP